ncbi:MAG: glycosyltransferase family 2 protein [Chloroflexi bacterium]|nr:glycosyltransferase family 2 protein [Chloroflexota bacterium]
MANPEPVDVSVIIPTRNAGDRFQECLAQIFGQKTRFSYEVLVIDSGSTDQTIRIASSFPTRVVRIPTRDFNHGRTRNLGANLAKGRFLVFTVQDAVPGHESWLDSLVAPLEADNSVAGSYSRQVPLPWANLFVKDLYEWSGTTSHYRRVKSVGGNGAWESMSPRAQLDLARFDNVSSCVRKAVLLEIPFPVVDFAEDLHWGKSVLQRGYKLVYEPASFVLHSHSRSLVYDYHRAFLSSQAYYRAFGIRDITGVRGFLDNFRGGFTHRLDLIRRSDLKDEQKANARAQAFLLTFAETLGRWQGAR